MNHSTGAPTKAQSRRFAMLYELGCVCCHIERIGYEPPHIHHILSGGKRMGHDFTIPLCPWHHVGLLKAWETAHTMESRFGPSLALNKRAFVAKYGPEMKLLEMTNDHLEAIWVAA